MRWHLGSMLPAASDCDDMANKMAPANANVRQRESNIIAPNGPSLRSQDARVITHLQLIVEHNEPTTISLNLMRWVSLRCRPAHHSGLMLAARMTFAHLSCSSARSVPNS